MERVITQQMINGQSSVRFILTGKFADAQRVEIDEHAPQYGAEIVGCLPNNGNKIAHYIVPTEQQQAFSEIALKIMGAPEPTQQPA